MADFIFRQLINGEWVDAADCGTWDLLNPATEESLGLMPYGGGADAYAAIAAAAAAFPAWRDRSAYERAAILLKAAEWIAARQDELAVLTTEEAGKPLREARLEWLAAINNLTWMAEECKRNYGRLIPARLPGRRIMVIHQPLGVVGVITAWNFPVYNNVRAWAAALAAGCTVVGKPSEYTPRSSMALAQALVESGLPAGVLNVVNGDAAAIGEAMLKDPRCRKISFTGSTRVGKLLMDGASETVTRLGLELGGNAPVIIFPDVKDLKDVAEKAVFYKYRNCGQVCISPQRFYVHSRVAEEFLDRVSTLTEKVRLGNGMDDATETGPLINAIQRDRLEGLVADAAARGAAVLAGGSRPADLPKGYFYRPTVVTGITDTMRLSSEEIFGPVMPVYPFSDPDEALALANASEYGLAAYIHTGDMATAFHMYEHLEYGMIGVNDWYPSTPEAPFGGVKQSGMGREVGPEGFYDYTEVKTVYLGGL
ncbi:MAG: NAD-dependent succinate-semialdehyde dehydrogenase [Anaerolineae bacterium]|nr:NAD-dependent succinate-semialdehyde dehydrogenase [Anaerolineae bacterium]